MGPPKFTVPLFAAVTLLSAAVRISEPLRIAVALFCLSVALLIAAVIGCFIVVPWYRTRREERDNRSMLRHLKNEHWKKL